MKLLESGRCESNDEANRVEILPQNDGTKLNENIPEEKNRTEYLKEDFFGNFNDIL